MASYQRVALFIFFDAIESDLVARIRSSCGLVQTDILTPDERKKAQLRLQARNGDVERTDYELLHGLDLGDKYSILLRHKNRLDQSTYDYFASNRSSFEKAIPIRNSTMHGRPLTTEEYSVGFSIAYDFLQSPGYWPSLYSTYKKYGQNPEELLNISVSLWDEPVTGQVLNNLPVPDYDDTGFQPRRALESDLKKKILGRHPVITVLGDGGDGKTALTLQTLYGLLHSNDHDFDAFVWVSAKTNRLTTNEIERIEGAITSSLGIFQEIADQFESGQDSPIARVRRLLQQNKVLLVIDNLETVLDETLSNFAADVPGDSKIVFTSRVPLGGDLSVRVPPFTESESLPYLRRLIEAYDITALRRESDTSLRRHLARLANKPLLVKWFAIGVSKGLDPSSITANPSIALKFCMENVFNRLGESAHKVLSVMTVVPQSLSAAILQHIAFLQSTQIEEGLAELIRFGIIERSESSEFERLYRIKPFARSYISRVLRLTTKDADEILSRFRGVSGAYQAERGVGRRNRYDIRSFTVRSQSEAIAARRLRHSSTLALKGRFEEATDIIAELKISSPEYFEVYRTLAFIQYRQGDVSGALSSYEAALDIAKDQPQLNYFYGGFLMRSYEDFAGARSQFDAALSIDPNEAAVLREAARANLFLYDFDRAQDHVTKAWTSGFKTFRDEVIMNDIQAQIHVRQSEHLLATGDPRGAFEAIKKLHDFLISIKPEVIDQTMIDHLTKAFRVLDELTRLPIADPSFVARTANIIRNLSPRIHPSEDDHNNDDYPIINRFGELKQYGRTQFFGFIRDTFGVETYINKSSVSSTLWRDMCNGRTVRFDIYTDGSRNWAENVTLV